MSAELFWHAAAATVVGPRHTRAGQAGEDAVGSQRTASGQIVVVADGHGSERCFRSARGASLAVNSAISALSGHLQRSLDAIRDPAMVAVQLVEGWREAVLADLQAVPMGSLPGDLELNGDDEFIAYGTTLLAAAATNDTVLIAHLGDGESLIASMAGGTGRPFPRDPQLAADATTSLALPDAEQHLRVALFDRHTQPIDLVILASDGYSNAFADDAAFDQVGADLLAWLQAPDPEWVSTELPRWLEQTAGVSGDDASLGLLYRWQVSPAH